MTRWPPPHHLAWYSTDSDPNRSEAWFDQRLGTIPLPIPKLRQGS
jgi:hypothetical protein